MQSTLFVIVAVVLGALALIAFVLIVVQPFIESVVSKTIDGDERMPEEVEQIGSSLAHWLLSNPD